MLQLMILKAETTLGLDPSRQRIRYMTPAKPLLEALGDTVFKDTVEIKLP